MNRDLICDISRGLNIRVTPESGQIVGVLKRGQHFQAISLQKIIVAGDNHWWAQSADNLFVLVANGSHVYVKQADGKSLPLG